jgi:hypothetical protein
MATRSAIGYAQPSGRIRAVYCHWDGSPTHQLPILQEHYGTLRKVQALIRPGSMSSLRTTETWESDYSRDTNGNPSFIAPRTHLRDPQPLYHHERGKGIWCAPDGSYGDPPATSPDLSAAEAHWRGHCCEHLYVFRPGYGWFHYEL